jgi:isopentenyl phosphate kinase
MSRYVLKIGGSVLTDKEEEEILSQDFEEIISHVRPGGILVHGAGSFGHPHAERHDLAEGSRKGVLETHSAVSKLNSKVIEQLRENDVDAFPVHPSSMSLREDRTRIFLRTAIKMVEEGFTPVLHGDGIVHTGQGFSVLSGDEIAVQAENEVNSGRLGFCTSERGVLDEDGNVIPEITSLEAFSEKGVDGVDVTGGMRNKLEKIFEKKVDARIFGVEDLRAFMKGEEVGTLVRGSPGE